MIDTSYLFSNGNEFLTWKHYNCDGCKKYENESSNIKDAGCKAAFELDLATITGEMTEQALNYIGWNKEVKRPRLNNCDMKNFILKKVKINTSVFLQKSLF